MRKRIGIPIVVALTLSSVAAPVLGGGTNTIFTYGGGFHRPIPADADATKGMMQDAVVLASDHLLICDVDVVVTIRHTAAFDLQLFLVGPSGDAVTLNVSDPFEGYYEGADYLATTFDDEADTAIADATSPFAGSFRPRESLAIFDGQDAYGPWRLVVYDAYYMDSGHLESFVLRVAASIPDDPISVPSPSAGGLAFLGLAMASRLRAKTGRPVLRTGRRPSREPSAPASS